MVIVMIAVLFVLAYAVTRSFCQEKIWGGSITQIEEWPSMASVLTREDHVTTEAGAWRLRCGGVIITKSHLLTSAWCLTIVVEKEMATKDVIVRGNTEYWKCSCGRKRDHTIQSYLIHEDYKGQGVFKPMPFYENDLGIVTIEDSFAGLYEIPKPYSEASRYWDSGNKQTAIIGWGFNSDNGIIQDQLRRGTINIYDQETCNKIYGKPLPPSTYCAAIESDNKWGPCEYDSGGPQFGILNETILIGIFSTGEGCTNKPAVFTNISGFASWINDKLEENPEPNNWEPPDDSDDDDSRSTEM